MPPQASLRWLHNWLLLHAAIFWQSGMSAECAQVHSCQSEILYMPDLQHSLENCSHALSHPWKLLHCMT